MDTKLPLNYHQSWMRHKSLGSQKCSLQCPGTLKNGITLQVFLIEFEWAGPEGTARYPLFMNRSEITWPGGAEDGLPIRKEHDEWWLHALMQSGGRSGQAA